MIEGLRRAGRLLLRLPQALVGVAALAWMALLWRLSEMPLGEGEPSFLWSWTANLAHAPLFGLLGLLFAALLLRGGPPGAWPRADGAAGGMVLVLVGLYGAADEIHQSRVPGRDGTAADLVTDLAGAVSVLWIIAYLGHPAAAAGGLRRRLLLGVVFCAASALLVTLC
ncbi:MAG: VanZ family protein [Planctomycetota bacterium]